MKKAYKKPVIVFEDFSLSTNIAAGCEEILNLPSTNACFPTFGRKTLFSDQYSDSCGYKVVEGTPDPDVNYDGFCYHNPSESYNLFNS